MDGPVKQLLVFLVQRNESLQCLIHSLTADLLLQLVLLSLSLNSLALGLFKLPPQSNNPCPLVNDRFLHFLLLSLLLLVYANILIQSCDVVFELG